FAIQFSKVFVLFLKATFIVYYLFKHLSTILKKIRKLFSFALIFQLFKFNIY
ncbi:hypothetical protein HMPREF1557_00702, partial [Streptococcus sobrinus W1703]